MTVISNCDATTDWTGTALAIDTTDKKEGTGSLKDTVATPVIPTEYRTYYNPAGTWDWSDKKHILLWLKSDRASTAFTYTLLRIWEGANWRRWDFTFSAGEWTAVKKLLSTGTTSATPPNLALIDEVEVYFTAKDEIAFYKKIDNVWVSRQTYDSSLFMTMDMKL